MYVLTSDDLAKAKLTIGLVFVNFICFIIFQSPLGEQYAPLLEQYNRKVLHNLQLWRLFTSMFLHADIMHFFSNVFALFIFGALIEREFSKIKYIILYFTSGLIGNIFTLFLFPPNTISLGASGAVFGLIGAAFIIIAIDYPPLIVIAFVYIAFFLVSSLAPGINIWAHLFGLISGVGLGYYFKRKRDRIYEYY